MVYCSALNCQNGTSGMYKNSTVSFYSFPLQNKALLKQWVHNMGRDIGTPTKYQRLCSKHFEDSSFVIDSQKVKRRRRLLKEAVPKKFLLGEDGNWLVGTPQGFCSRISNKIRKRIRTPEFSRIPATYNNTAAQEEGSDLEDWQEFYKKLIKENYVPLTTLDTDDPVPRRRLWTEVPRIKDERDSGGRDNPAGPGTGTTIRSKLQSLHVKEPCSFPAESRDLICPMSNKGGISENLSSVGSTGQDGCLEEGDHEEYEETMVYPQSPAEEKLFPCAANYQQLDTVTESYICTDCGNNFECLADVIHHRSTQHQEEALKL